MLCYRGSKTQSLLYSSSTYLPFPGQKFVLPPTAFDNIARSFLTFFWKCRLFLVAPKKRKKGRHLIGWKGFFFRLSNKRQPFHEIKVIKPKQLKSLIWENQIKIKFWKSNMLLWNAKVVTNEIETRDGPWFKYAKKNNFEIEHFLIFATL